MRWVADLDAIVEARDLRWSARIFERLCEVPPEDREPLVDALADLDDPRMVAPIRDVIFGDGDDGLRLALADMVWSGGGVSSWPQPSSEELRAWWRDGDDVVRRFALWQMWPSEEDILRPTVEDASHPLREAAIEGAAFGLPPIGRARSIATGLDDARPGVRVAAARALVWAEAIEAEPALRHAARDPSLEVVDQALLSLGWFPTRAAVRLAIELVERAPAPIVDWARSCLWQLADRVECLTPRRVMIEPLRRWLGADWDRLRIQTDTIEPDPRSVTPPAERVSYPWLSSPAEFDARFGSLDAAWRPLLQELREAEWRAVPAGCHEPLAERLLAHPDSAVRRVAATALVALGDLGRIERLLDDPCRRVRSAAREALARGKPGVSPPLAERLWPEAATSRFGEALRAAIAVSEPSTWPSRALALAADPATHHDARVSAIEALGDAGATRELDALMPLLAEPPVVNWWVHAALCEEALRHGLRFPDVRHLAHEDHVTAQVVVAASRLRPPG